MSITEQDLARLAEIYNLETTKPHEHITWLNNGTTRIEATNSGPIQRVIVDDAHAETELNGITLFDPSVRFIPAESREPGSPIRPRVVLLSDMYTNMAVFNADGRGAFRNGIIGDISEHDFDPE